MSDTMLLGVLRMPFELAMSTPTARFQYHQRGVQAADEIEELRAEVERLREVLRWYADLTNYMPPVVVVFEEPPALLDKGALAREVLEARP